MTLTAAELALQFDPDTRALWHLERRVRRLANEGTKGLKNERNVRVQRP